MARPMAVLRERLRGLAAPRKRLPVGHIKSGSRSLPYGKQISHLSYFLGELKVCLQLLLLIVIGRTWIDYPPNSF